MGLYPKISNNDIVNASLSDSTKALQAAGLLNESLTLNKTGRKVMAEFMRTKFEKEFVAAVEAAMPKEVD